MRIRSYQRGDRDAVISLWNECELVVPWNNPARDIGRKLKVDPDLFLVGLDEGGVVATVMGGYDCLVRKPERRPSRLSREPRATHRNQHHPFKRQLRENIMQHGINHPHSALRFCSYLAILLLVSSMTVTAQEYGYDPEADPALTYQRAIEQAGEQGKLVLLVFGSEWCTDCRSLNKKMRQSPLSDTVEGNFIVAHVDIGNWDRNMAFTEQFGEPVAKGIPSIAIVGQDKTLLYVSEAGEFASARSTGLASLDTWFKDRLDVIRQQ